MIPPAEKMEQLTAQLAAYEDELRRAYALLWQKQAALDAADRRIAELMAWQPTQPYELEIWRGEDANSPH